MECNLAVIPFSSEVYIEGIPEVLKYVGDNRRAYIINHTPYVRMSDCLNDLFDREFVEACYFTDEQDIEVLLLDERMTIGQLQAIGNKISYEVIVSVGVKEYEGHCHMGSLLSVVYRKLV